jgi:tellurite resistance protein TehA-like permease
MKNVWYLLNIAVVALGLRGGYLSVAPEQLRHMNPDSVLCGVLLAVATVFAVGCVSYSKRRWNHDKLRRPSFDRNPLNWWHDPLQSLFVSTCFMVSMTLGAALRRPAIGSTGFWTFGTYACLAVGLVIGQIIVYRIYRQNIIPA